MTDVRADDIRDSDLDGDDRLPWLEAVEDEERGPSAGKLIAALVVGLVAIGVIVGGLFWLGNRSGAGATGGGNAEIIAAPEGDYKVRPENPGGMQLDNRGTAQTAASEGTETNASLDRGQTPEAPVTRPQTPATNAAQTRPQPAQVAPTVPPVQQAPGRPQPATPQPRLSGPLIQVGAFPSEAVANAEWARMTQRFPYLRGLQHNVITYQRGNQTFYRLRAGGSDARAVCARLRGANQPCYDVPAGQ
jgi:SPOR domain